MAPEPLPVPAAAVPTEDGRPTWPAEGLWSDEGVGIAGRSPNTLSASQQ